MVSLHVRLTKEQFEELRRLAYEQRLTYAEILRRGFKLYLEASKRRHQ